jgi:hypothetical protein
VLIPLSISDTSGWFQSHCNAQSAGVLLTSLAAQRSETDFGGWPASLPPLIGSIITTASPFEAAYFKPFWTDCQTEGYSSDNFGMIYWERPKGLSSTSVERIKFFAETNCVKISHLLSHEIMRMMGKSRKIYFDGVHELCEKHRRGKLPFLYFNDRFDLVPNTESYHFSTIDIKKMATQGM